MSACWYIAMPVVVAGALTYVPAVDRLFYRLTYRLVSGEWPHNT